MKWSIDFPLRFSRGADYLWDIKRKNGKWPIAVYCGNKQWEMSKSDLHELVRRANRDWRREMAGKP